MEEEETEDEETDGDDRLLLCETVLPPGAACECPGDDIVGDKLDVVSSGLRLAVSIL